MTRRHFTIACEGAALAATLDEGGASAGLLLVSGGNELRSGAWGGQALLAARIATEGFPVLRFDRRGVGDSDGPNGGFRSSAPDLAAALAAFRAECPAMRRVIGLGNCDAASALMLAPAGFNGLLLSNPWTIEGDDDNPPPAAVRAHYRSRLTSPAAVIRLLTGKVSLAKLVGSLRDALRPAPPPTTLAQEMTAGIARFAGPIAFLIAERDRTAQTFLAAWPKDDRRIAGCTDATHSFVEPQAREWLAQQVLAMLRG
jgi:exosortase A-associated hydrolase 1